MNSQEYLEKRVEDQIGWMEGKCKLNQSRYKRLKVIEIVSAALIPLLVSYKADGMLRDALSISVGLLGVLIVILTSLRQLYKYQENWITYRATLESMKREKFLYETNASPYDDSSAFQKFVMNIESLLAKENESWKAVWTQKDPEINNPSLAPINPETLGQANVVSPSEAVPSEKLPPLDADENYKMTDSNTAK